ncbi:hypothetical protein [Myceligenerans salitolerans]|uniref:Uncharacterized protein n=1 Tax=Myceligenerans salitolerans TaxID=1230528 RepID=A0ABS3I3X4_9MICO|nr:hypothetical protein [Myceligenerans salitolerans]MBO0607690.1 hypothetical protein [Myceligenerans salitolerans]
MSRSDWIAMAALIPVAIAVVQVAAFSYGRPSVMALILRSEGALNLVGASIVQTAPTFMAIFLGGYLTIPELRKQLKGVLSGKPWIFPVVVLFSTLALTAISWLNLAYALTVLLMVIILYQIFRGALWVNRTGYPGFILWLGRLNRRRPEVPYIKWLFGKLAKHYISRHAKTTSPSSGAQATIPGPLTMASVALFGTLPAVIISSVQFPLERSHIRMVQAWPATWLIRASPGQPS